MAKAKLSSAYANAAMADPDTRAVYETQAAEENRQPYRIVFLCNLGATQFERR